MRIKWQRDTSTRLTCELQSGRLDGNVPIDRVFIEGPELDRITDQRLALVGYLLVREITSSTIEFDGITVAPFLAAAFVQDFPGDELFVSPLEQTDRFIVHPHRKAVKQAFGSINGKADVTVERTEFGFTVVSTVESKTWEYSSNMQFFLAMASGDPVLSYQVIMAALTFDILNAHVLLARRSEVMPDGLVQKVGFSWDFRDE